MSTKNKQHGGRRKGAGRPKTKEPTKVIRVPLSLVQKVELLIQEYKQKIDKLKKK